MTVTLTWDDQFAGKGSVVVDLPPMFGSWKKELQKEFLHNAFEKELGVKYNPDTCSYELEIQCEDAVFNMGFGEYQTLPMAWYDVRDYYPENVLIDSSNADAKVLKVLVAIKSDRNNQYTVRSQTRQKGKYYGQPNTWEWGKFSGGRITHWMPLPMYPGFEVEE